MKDIKKILLLVLCFLININFCYAFAGISTSYNDPGKGGSGEGASGDTDGDGMINGKKKLSSGLYCDYDYGVNYGGDIKVYGYDQNNKEIINNRIIPDTPIKAGTSIGISIIEKKTVSYTYDYEVEANETCKGVYSFQCYKDGNWKTYEVVGRDSSEYINYDYDGDCLDSVFVRWTDCTGYVTDTDRLECETEVKSKAQGLAESYIASQSFDNIKLLNPNDAAMIDEEDDGSVTISTNKACDDGDCSDGKCSCTHTYTPKSVCINKITSNITYDKVSCEENTEFHVKNEKVNDVEHFHYFIPMNVTSGWFSLILSENGEKLENNRCEELIKANPLNFYDFFVGVRATGETFSFSDNITTAINSLDYGCYVRTEIRIPVSKGIYNVEDNKIMGYNLYVKNVDEDNPFPNPVTKLDSLWFDWYKSNYSGGSYNSGGSPNIRESFSEEPSYKLENVKAKEIRNLNSGLGNYLKVSLNENGSSDFIRKEIVFNKLANPNTYYKLGCGPINSVETIIVGTDIITNPLYQEGCK